MNPKKVIRQNEESVACRHELKGGVELFRGFPGLQLKSRGRMRKETDFPQLSSGLSQSDTSPEEEKCS